MLQVQELVKDYRKVRAVDRVSFDVGEGEIVGLLGPNGAGKTSLLRCCASILQPTTGHILIKGVDLVKNPSLAKRGLAYVPEVPNLYELLTVDEHLRFVAMCFKSLERYDRLGDQLLKQYDLMEKKNELVATLSKGMRQKLSIACAMVHDAKVLLFDEPLIGVDPAGVSEFKTEIAMRREEGCSILISTHLLDTAEKLCDRVVILAKGKKVAEGTVEQLRVGTDMESADLEHLFLSLTQTDAPPPLSR